MRLRPRVTLTVGTSAQIIVACRANREDNGLFAAVMKNEMPSETLAFAIGILGRNQITCGPKPIRQGSAERQRAERRLIGLPTRLGQPRINGLGVGRQRSGAQNKGHHVKRDGAFHRTYHVELPALASTAAPEQYVWPEVLIRKSKSLGAEEHIDQF